jgi:hypothetical protein
MTSSATILLWPNQQVAMELSEYVVDVEKRSAIKS